MSTPETTPTPPAADAPATTTPETTTGEGGKWFAVGGIALGILGILISLYFFAFHLGAAVLSYQKFGSFLWAILDFFFPYFYYPYYAFVASKEPAPVPESSGLVGGARRLPHKIRGTRYRRI